ncbi:MAG: hypothetical protein Q7S05_01830 [bacterium]|nr:hypothetical protein [bacterium]
MTSGYELVANSLPSVPTDWIIIVILVILIAFDAVRSGLGRVTSLVLSLPATLFLISALPHAKVLSGLTEQFSAPLLKAVIFGVVFVATYLLVRRMSDPYETKRGEVIQALLAGVAGTAIAVVVWLQVPELQSVWHFGPQVQAVFGEQYRFWWLLISLIALSTFRR